MRAVEGPFETARHGFTKVVVVSIAGRAGAGKTALATRVAHRLRPSFPDGQLYVNLRGAEAKHMESAEVLVQIRTRPEE
jgi:uridine kinase